MSIEVLTPNWLKLKGRLLAIVTLPGPGIWSAPGVTASGLPLRNDDDDDA